MIDKGSFINNHIRLPNPSVVLLIRLKLEARVHSIESTIRELKVERNKGAIDIGRYLQLKEESEYRKDLYSSILRQHDIWLESMLKTIIKGKTNEQR